MGHSTGMISQYPGSGGVAGNLKGGNATVKTEIRIALAQINPIVGDLEGNSQKIIDYIGRARESGAEMVLFPELSVTGYPPEDLLLKPKFMTDTRNCVEEIAKHSHDIITIIGFVGKEKKLHNIAGVLWGGELAAIYRKICLPNYSVFDEKRYFEPGERPLVFEWRGLKFGLSVCEDMWIPDAVLESQAFRGGADIILNISASPYCMGKVEERLSIGTARARITRTIFVYLNLIGGQDELVFDGSSFIVDHRGEKLLQMRQFQEDFAVIDLDVSSVREFRDTDPSYPLFKKEFDAPYDIDFVSLYDGERQDGKATLSQEPVALLQGIPEIYGALVLGTRDYVRKNGFEKVVIGLSGGIDSALTAAIAADALGQDNVIGILMPSQFTSDQSIADAEKLARNLGIQTKTISIQDTFETYLRTLQPIFQDRASDVTEENVQARIRGNILMALSNKFGWLVLTTGNKSETSVGYCTLYGDMAGGFAVIKDVPKTMVYELCRNRNEQAGSVIIPESVLKKAPTAELRAGQKDQDSLPAYEQLDAILELFITQDKSVKEIIEAGYPREVVKKVARLVDRNEYKRRQAPPGIKITSKAFGKDRRMPITNHFNT